VVDDVLEVDKSSGEPGSDLIPPFDSVMDDTELRGVLDDAVREGKRVFVAVCHVDRGDRVQKFWKAFQFPVEDFGACVYWLYEDLLAESQKRGVEALKLPDGREVELVVRTPVTLPESP
jgi:hypothetical protein